MRDNPEGLGTTRPMREALDAVLDRLQRELVRLPHASTPHDVSTARIGGFAKLGAALDRYLHTVFCYVALHAATSPDELAKRLSLRLDRATMGTLAHALRPFAALPLAQDPAVRWILAELHDRSALARVIDLRNRFVHQRTLPPVNEVHTCLVQLGNALKPQRMLLNA
ncbi:MAG: hypothetical protein Q8Q09_24605 [Deltaproteobacteria bacterium]|nr:hypothetical protein [Deltaproteobacteria bacterium]